MESILVIRLSAIGDVVMASPLIGALRRAYPDARLTWLAQPDVAELLTANQDLDEVMVWPRGEWRRLKQERHWLTLAKRIWGFRSELRRRRFDIAIDAQGLLKSGIWAWLSGAPQRIAIDPREGSRWLMSRRVERGGDPERIGSEYLHLARALRLPSDDFAMRIALTGEDRKSARRLLAEQGVDGPFAIICPFTTRPQKHWLEARWAQLVPRMAGELGLPAVMLGGPSDREAAERIVERSPSHLIDLVGRTRLRQAAALIDKAALLVGVDTGLSHMGIAFATPSVLLFGPTLPYTDTTRENARVIHHPMTCSPCKRKPTCHGDFTCMRGIEVAEVLETARKVMAVGTRAP
jgi:heptosyltransferase-1